MDIVTHITGIIERTMSFVVVIQVVSAETNLDFKGNSFVCFEGIINQSRIITGKSIEQCCYTSIQHFGSYYPTS